MSQERFEIYTSIGLQCPRQSTHCTIDGFLAQDGWHICRAYGYIQRRLTLCLPSVSAKIFNISGSIILTPPGRCRQALFNAIKSLSAHGWPSILHLRHFVGVLTLNSKAQASSSPPSRMTHSSGSSSNPSKSVEVRGRSLLTTNRKAERMNSGVKTVYQFGAQAQVRTYHSDGREQGSEGCL